jgi:oligopeptide/dipeptide ABC transporter ATP-binding protein
MYLGRIVELAPARTLYAQPRHPYTRSLLSAVPKPEPRRERERIVLGGDVPDPSAPPPGCPFHPRCPHPRKDEECRSRVPPLVQVGDGHLVACLKETSADERGA